MTEAAKTAKKTVKTTLFILLGVIARVPNKMENFKVPKNTYVYKIFKVT